MQSFLPELNLPMSIPMSMHCDNQVGIYIANKMKAFSIFKWIVITYETKLLKGLIKVLMLGCQNNLQTFLPKDCDHPLHCVGHAQRL